MTRPKIRALKPTKAGQSILIDCICGHNGTVERDDHHRLPTRWRCACERTYKLEEPFGPGVAVEMTPL